MLLMKTLKITIFVHIYLFIVFMTGFILNKKKYGEYYLNDGFYFNVMFLQFFPITFCLIFILLFIYYRFFKKK